MNREALLQIYQEVQIRKTRCETYEILNLCVWSNK